VDENALLSAEQVVAMLGLEPHPEGGLFRETFRETPMDGVRGASTAIYFLLRRHERSEWHRIDADEVWHHYAGAPLVLRQSNGVERAVDMLLGDDLLNDQRPQIVVPAGMWQSAETLGEWTLVGCTVAPAFDFSGFEMAPPGWEPGETIGEDGRVE
jgi:predicted cupin superfamily sugar epimerase